VETPAGRPGPTSPRTPPPSGTTVRPLRRDRLGGLLHEYVQVACGDGVLGTHTLQERGRPQLRDSRRWVITLVQRFLAEGGDPGCPPLTPPAAQPRPHLAGSGRRDRRPAGCWKNAPVIELIPTVAVVSARTGAHCYGRVISSVRGAASCRHCSSGTPRFSAGRTCTATWSAPASRCS
jgi:hypothetical protein